MEFPMQLSGVQVFKELFQLAWNVYILDIVERRTNLSIKIQADGKRYFKRFPYFKFGKQIHVPEAIDSDKWQIFFALS